MSRKKIDRSRENWLPVMMRVYVAKAITDSGRKIKCEKCGKLRGLEFHHEKYHPEEDVSIKDIKILCHKCHRNAKKKASNLSTVFIKDKRYCLVNNFRFAY